MIIKIFNPTTNGYTVIADVSDYTFYYERVRCPNRCKEPGTCGECPDLSDIRDFTLLERDMDNRAWLYIDQDETHPISIVHLWLQTKTGQEFNLWAEVNNTYVMNDEGKTIEHF